MESVRELWAGGSREPLGRLKGRVALVTGAARRRGMGNVIAGGFAREGAAVALADIAPQVSERARELAEAGHRAEGFVSDLTRADEVAALVSAVTTRLGPIDILCNVAGKSVPPRPPFLEMTEEYWDMVMDRNLKTAFQCCRAVLPLMAQRRYGKVVNIGSTTGPVCVYRYSAAYAVSKGALSAFTRALALEFGRFDVTVNVILPGDIDTDDVPWTPEAGRRDIGVLDPHLDPPIARPGRPEEVADLAVFLATDESRYITGAEIVIDGGLTVLEAVPALRKL